MPDTNDHPTAYPVPGWTGPPAGHRDLATLDPDPRDRRW
jgi:hypothetical protein